MMLDKLTRDLTKNLTRRQLRYLTHEGVGLDFKRGIYYTKGSNRRVRLGRLTDIAAFNRATMGTFRDFDGYISQAPNNLLWNTHDMTALGWGGSGYTISAVGDIAPDGTPTAYRVAETTPVSAHFLSQSATVLAGQTYTASVYVKYAGQRYFIFGFGKSGAPFNRAWSLCDLSLGTISNFDINSPTRVYNRRIDDVGNGWFRVSHTVLMDHTSTDGFLEFRFSNGGGTYAGDPNAQLLFWGPQLQIGTRLAPYIPSTSAASKYDQPRFEHDASGNRLGFLSEISRNNQFLWSQEAGNAAWSLSLTTVTSNVINAPDNTITGDKVTETAALGEHRAHRQFPSVGAGTMVNMSVFAKAGERTKIMLRILDNASPGDGSACVYDLSLGTISAGPSTLGAATLVSARITPYADGWYRCDLTVKANATVITYVTDTFVCDAAGSGNYTGDGTSGLYVWGAQFEVGQKPTSYIPTTSTSGGRNADTLVITPLGNEYNAVSGSIVVVGYAPAGVEQSNGQNFYSLSDNTSNNRISLLQPITGTLARFAVTAAAATQALLDATFTSSARFKHAAAWTTNDVAVSFNGAAVLTDNSYTTPTIDRFEIGTLGGGNNMNAIIESIDYYSKRLSNEELVRQST